MLQITGSGPVFSGTTADLERLRSQFNRQHCVRLSEFLTTHLLNLIQERLSHAEFTERVHEQIGPNKELCMDDDFAYTLLHFLINSQRLFQIVQEITGCNRIGSFEGRVYRVTPGQEHRDSWHDDMVGHRLIGMSINLSTEIYSGGILQIRDRQSKQIVNETANVGFGDAIIFRLASHLQHRITTVEGTASKTAFAGWFKSEPEFLSLLKENSS